MTKLIKSGANAVGATLGDGWYRGYIGFGGQRNFYEERVALLLQIRITYKDGREEIVGTDAKWKAATGPILMSDIYNGETYDARLEKTGWTNEGFDDTQWSSVRVAAYPRDNLISPAAPPVREIEELKPIRIFKTSCLQTIRALPGDCSLEEIAERIEFMAAVQKGLDQLDTGEDIPHDEVKKQLASWLTSFSHSRCQFTRANLFSCEKS